MSLIERSNRALKAGNADRGSGQRDETDEFARSFEYLRNQVQRQISADEIAALMRSNPHQARNEVRSACRRAFSHPHWETVSSETRSRLVEQLLDSIFGFGPLEALLADETVTEIMVNGSRSLFFERDGKLFQSERVFTSDDEVRTLIDRILGPLGRRIDEAQPMVNARLAQGHRVNAVIPPIAPDGPHLTIRKFSTRIIALEEMQAAGSFDARARKLLEWAVALRKNIAVSGGTGSGKTTLLNALSCLISPGERVVTIEDSLELRFLEHPHVVRLEARPLNTEGTGEIGIRDLVVNALRMRPDRIVVGECRSAEALDMLQAMNTGHDGSLTTLHANSPKEAISRLTTMVRYAVDLPVDVIEANIASAIDLVVQTARALDGSRYISEIAGFVFDGQRRRCGVETYYRREPLQKQGIWLAEPAWIDDASRFGLVAEEEANAWKHDTPSAA